MYTPGDDADQFPIELRKKARKIEEVAVRRRVEELNAYSEMGDGAVYPPDEEYFLYGTRTGVAVAYPITPQSPEWKTVEKHYSWISDAFEVFADLPNPQGFNLLASHIERTLQAFGISPAPENTDEPEFANTVWGYLSSSSTWISHWYGQAATQFAEFSDPFEYVVHNQAAAAKVLHTAATATAKVYENARKDVLQVADKTLAALRGYGDGLGFDLYFTLAITTAVASFLTTIPTSGTSLPIFFGGIASTAGLIKDYTDRDSGKSNDSEAQAVIGGNRVDEIISSMSQELSRLNRLIDQEEQKVKKILERNYLVVVDSRHELEAPRPKLADLTSGPVEPYFTPPH